MGCDILLITQSTSSLDLWVEAERVKVNAPDSFTLNMCFCVCGGLSYPGAFPLVLVALLIIAIVIISIT